MPPPSKKARDDEAATIQPGQKPKREWVASYNMENPAGSSMQDREIAGPVAQEHSAAGPSTFHHTLPGPSRAAPLMQGQEVALQHALPGPSGAQAQRDYANVSNFFLPFYFFQCFFFFNPNINLSL